MRPVIVILAFLFAPALHSQQPTHGTINILLANGNGMVLVTDSRASDSSSGLPIHDRSQKLFQIDSVTVCSIAGFATDSGPHGAIKETASGEIRSAIDGLADSHANLSFQQKVSAFTDLLGGRLPFLETDYAYAAKTANPRPSSQTLIMLFAGFDLDGSSQIAKVNISINTTTLAPHTTFKAHVDVSMQPVGKNFVYLTSGIDDSAQLRLKAPGMFDKEPDLDDYRQAVRDGRTADLRLDQMERLARYLEKDASKSTPVIGGPVQITTLANKQVVSFERPPNLIVYPKPYPTTFEALNTIEDSPFEAMIYRAPSVHAVYVGDNCIHAAVQLDGLVLIAGIYSNCNFFFDGGEFYRDLTTEIHGGKLILGPHAPKDSNSADAALKSFPELTPVSYTDLPDAENIAKHFWPSN